GLGPAGDRRADELRAQLPGAAGGRRAAPISDRRLCERQSARPRIRPSRRLRRVLRHERALRPRWPRLQRLPAARPVSSASEQNENRDISLLLPERSVAPDLSAAAKDEGDAVAQGGQRVGGGFYPHVVGRDIAAADRPRFVQEEAART